MKVDGTDQKVAIVDDVVLDFTKLFDPLITSKEAEKGPKNESLCLGNDISHFDKKTSIEPKIDHLEKEQSKQLFLQVRQKKEEHKRLEEIYREYQDNIQKSSQLQTEILKGLREGEDIYILFLKAVKAISMMTSTEVFYTQVEKDLKSVYGKGLRERIPIELELREVKTRLERLVEAEKDEEDRDGRERIRNAIKAHRAIVNKLEGMIVESSLSQ